MIAGGLGSFEPRKPIIENLLDFEQNGVNYIVKDPDQYQGKEMVISGGGDSALDWAVYFAENMALFILCIGQIDFEHIKTSVAKAYELEETGQTKALHVCGSEAIGGKTTTRKGHYRNQRQNSAN